MERTILLADHHTIFREVIRKLLEKREDLRVVGEAADGQQAMLLAQQLKPDVVLMEITLPRLSGLEVTRRLVRSGCRSSVLILSVHDSRPHVEEALRAGASGYLVKTGSSDELMQAIDAVGAGRSYLSSAVAQHVVDAITCEGHASSPNLRRLTSREREVLQLIAEGLSNKEIATELGVSTRTIDSHRFNLMEKLSIRRVSGLVRFAIREGLLGP